MTTSRQQWPRGPINELHVAAMDGSTECVLALLSRGSIDIDQGTPRGCTPLMVAAQEGHSGVVKILLNRRTNVSIASDDDSTALHFSAFYGHFVWPSTW